MSNTPHELAEEFPEHAAKMSALKQADAHFAKLAEEYHAINRQVHRAETNVEPMDNWPKRPCASSARCSRTRFGACSPLDAKHPQRGLFR